jgi:hypothetical protein
MRTILVLLLAAGVALSASPLHAQGGGTLRIDPGGNPTTGRGADRTILPPYVPVPRADVESDGRPRPANSDDGKESKVPGDAPAPPPPAAEVKEDPRTMITRDRIESPQH